MRFGGPADWNGTSGRQRGGVHGGRGQTGWSHGGSMWRCSSKSGASIAESSGAPARGAMAATSRIGRPVRSRMAAASRQPSSTVSVVVSSIKCELTTTAVIVQRDAVSIVRRIARQPSTVSVNGRFALMTCHNSYSPSATLVRNEASALAPASSPPTSRIVTTPSGGCSMLRISGRTIGRSAHACAPGGTTTRMPFASIKARASRHRKYGFTRSRSAIWTRRPARARARARLTASSVLPDP